MFSRTRVRSTDCSRNSSQVLLIEIIIVKVGQCCFAEDLTTSLVKTLEQWKATPNLEIIVGCGRPLTAV